MNLEHRIREYSRRRRFEAGGRQHRLSIGGGAFASGGIAARSSSEFLLPLRGVAPHLGKVPVFRTGQWVATLVIQLTRSRASLRGAGLPQSSARGAFESRCQAARRS